MSQSHPQAESAAWLELVRQTVAPMSFGSVQIIVHEGRMTQVERTERTRLPGERVIAKK